MKMRVRQTTRNNMVWRTRNFRKIHLKIEPSEIMLRLEEKRVPDSPQPISIAVDHWSFLAFEVAVGRINGQ